MLTDDSLKPADDVVPVVGLLTEPGQIGRRPFDPGPLPDLPHDGSAAFISDQEQAGGTVVIVVDRRHGGQVRDLSAEPGQFTLADVTAVEEVQRPVERR
jgi:hypothetical protein